MWITQHKHKNHASEGRSSISVRISVSISSVVNQSQLLAVQKIRQELAAAVICGDDDDVCVCVCVCVRMCVCCPSSLFYTTILPTYTYQCL